MKKAFLLVLVLAMVAVTVPAFADTPLSTETLLNRMYNNTISPDGIAGAKRGQTIFHRFRTTVDTGFATPGSGVSCEGYRNAIVTVSVDGTGGAGWVITPYFGYPLNKMTSDATTPMVAKYFAGTSRTVSDDEQFLLRVDGCKDVYISCDRVAGTAPSICVWVTPTNE